METHGNIYRYVYIHRLQSTYIFVCFISWECLDVMTPQEKMSIPRANILVSNTILQWKGPRLFGEIIIEFRSNIYKISLEHLVVPEINTAEKKRD